MSLPDARTLPPAEQSTDRREALSRFAEPHRGAPLLFLRGRRQRTGVGKRHTETYTRAHK